VHEHKALLDRTAASAELTLDRLLQSSLLCVALHDLGKLAVNFQAMMQAPDEKTYRAALKQNYRHEIAALWFVERASRALVELNGTIPGQGFLEVMAVAGHHKYLADDYLFSADRFQQVLRWDPDAWTAVSSAYQLAQAMFRERGWRLPDAVKGVTRQSVERQLSSHPDNCPFDCLISARQHIAISLVDEPLQPVRELFLLLKGLLMSADWTASASVIDHKALDVSRSVVSVPVAAVTSHMHDKVERDRYRRPQLKPFTDFRPFQKACARASNHVLAIAPTGSGKTEAALLWALGQVERGQARKLIFLLPTMVTANSIYERLDYFFHHHGHHVGLVHSTADLLRDDDHDAQSEADRADVRANYLGTTHFFMPVTVATIDQLLVTLFHAGRWALKSFALADAAVVIDEVHAYDPHTTALLGLLLKQFRHMGTKFMVMSATMPSDLRNTLLEELRGSPAVQTLTGADLIEDKELLDQARNSWEVVGQPLTHWLSDTTDDLPKPSQAIRYLLTETPSEEHKHRRVLIVVNTVKRCQEIAKLLKEFNPVCYHSKYIFRDRRKKEKQISDCQPRLVVATQVVEVSLDIDYDVLLTECAPFDALVQRAGRVNRSRRPTHGRIIVFPCEAGSEKVYGEPAGILDASWVLCKDNQRLLTEADLIQLVERAYAGRIMAQHRDFLNAQAETEAVQRRLSGVLDNPRPEEESQLTARLEKYQQVSVIPKPVADEARRALPWDRRRFELRMPIWYVREHKIADDTNGLPICDMHYDSSLGARFLGTKAEPEPGLCMI
jgi:CRISPR-associated endonuclease/helicase Cas3